MDLIKLKKLANEIKATTDKESGILELLLPQNPLINTGLIDKINEIIEVVNNLVIKYK